MVIILHPPYPFSITRREFTLFRYRTLILHLIHGTQNMAQQNIYIYVCAFSAFCVWIMHVSEMDYICGSICYRAICYSWKLEIYLFLIKIDI